MIKNTTYAPLALRFIHDLVVSLVIFFLIYVFSLLSKTEVSVLTLICGPFILSTIYLLASGIGGFKTPQLFKQASILLLAVCVSIGLNYILGSDPYFSFLFHALAFFMLLAPRYYLNINRSQKSKVAKLALNTKGYVLIVGGAGYIGTHLIDILLSQNYSVRVLDKLMYDRTPILKFLNHPRFELIEGDATDISKIVRAVTNCSAVVHLAGLVGDPACAVDPDYTRHENVISARMLSEAAKSAGVSRFIFSSSCSVYGASDEIVNEKSPLNPVSLYAITKIDSEKELLNSATDDFHVTILRFATVFGHSFRPRFDLVTNLFCAQAYNEGKINVVGPGQWRPFVHCRDLARAIEIVLRSPIEKISGETFNVGDDKLNMTIGDLAEKVNNVAHSLNIKSELQISENITDRRNYRVSFQKIKSQLGFECETSIEDGSKEILTNMKNGQYSHYKNKEYSNVETTKQKVNLFYDPIHTLNIYRPVNIQGKETWG